MPVSKPFAANLLAISLCSASQSDLLRQPILLYLKLLELEFKLKGFIFDETGNWQYKHEIESMIQKYVIQSCLPKQRKLRAEIPRKITLLQNRLSKIPCNAKETMSIIESRQCKLNHYTSLRYAKMNADFVTDGATDSIFSDAMQALNQLNFELKKARIIS